jgi:hypothetical protein
MVHPVRVKIGTFYESIFGIRSHVVFRLSIKYNKVFSYLAGLE